MALMGSQKYVSGASAENWTKAASLVRTEKRAKNVWNLSSGILVSRGVNETSINDQISWTESYF